jgi:hypothetical protein
MHNDLSNLLQNAPAKILDGSLPSSMQAPIAKGKQRKASPFSEWKQAKCLPGARSQAQPLKHRIDTVRRCRSSCPWSVLCVHTCPCLSTRGHVNEGVPNSLSLQPDIHSSLQVAVHIFSWPDY